MIQNFLDIKSYTYEKCRPIFQNNADLYRKIKYFFSNGIPLPPLPITISFFLVVLVVYCAHQQRRLDQMVSINTCLRHTIHRQHNTLHEQEKILMGQAFKTRQQETALLKKDRKLLDLTHRIHDITAQVTLMHQQTTRLALLEEQVRKLTKMGGPPDPEACTGMGGSSQVPFARLSLSPNPPPVSLENDFNTLQQEMNATHQGLNHRIQRFKTLRDELETRNDILACTPSIKPAQGVISCGFGERTSPFSGKMEFHTGMDIANAKGTPVVASARGTVIFAQQKWLIGNLIVIDHSNGIITKYGHLDKFLVKKGDVVNRGDPIGLMGNTGKSTGPHVHYEVVVNEESENPAHYFSDELTASAP